MYAICVYLIVFQSPLMKIFKTTLFPLYLPFQRTASLESRETRATQLVQSVVRSASHVLSRPNHRGWSDLSEDERGRAATAIMAGLEENAFLLADAVKEETIIVKPTENIRKIIFFKKILFLCMVERKKLELLEFHICY